MPRRAACACCARSSKCSAASGSAHGIGVRPASAIAPGGRVGSRTGPSAKTGSSAKLCFGGGDGVQPLVAARAPRVGRRALAREERDDEVAEREHHARAEDPRAHGRDDVERLKLRVG